MCRSPLRLADGTVRHVDGTVTDPSGNIRLAGGTVMGQR